jgi:hypothetical protein
MGQVGSGLRNFSNQLDLQRLRKTQLNPTHKDQVGAILLGFFF